MVRPVESRAGDEIRPYRIHVSSKYLEQTRRKLQLTRLPHDTPEPKSDEWWEPQPTVEPLIDFWLDEFSWRDQEHELNGMPQFRTAIKTAAGSLLRLHFIHARSPRADAVPLLLIPPFPFTNLALTHLVGLFTDPDDAEADQPFHLVVPSLPGLGFSDGLANREPMIPAAAEMLDALMRRLGYRHFLVTNSGPSTGALAQVDWRVANHLAVWHPDSCLGAHFLSPPLRPPKVRDSPVEWAKWKAASMLQSPMLGYTKADLKALKKAQRASGHDKAESPCPAPLGFGGAGGYEPNTLAYALCDSPMGLLLFFLMVIRLLAPEEDLPPAEIIKMTELTWLPGPEGTMRLWAHCASREDRDERRRAAKPKAAITVFTGHEEEEHAGDERQGAGALPRPAPDTYACPAWGSRRYDIVSSIRVGGRPGMLAWERPGVIAAGARGLARAILEADGRLRASPAPAAASREAAVGHQAMSVRAETSATTIAVAEEAPAARKPREGHGEGVAARDIWENMAIQPVLSLRGRDEDAQSESDGSPDTVIAVRVGPRGASLSDGQVG